MSMTLLRARQLLAIAGLAVVGVAPADDLSPVESDFGNSVRNMIEQQIYDPRAAANPPAEAPSGIDGARAAAALKTYREPTPRSATPMSSDVPIGLNP